MYQYDDYDHRMLAERVAQYRDQTARYLDGKLSEAEFLPLRLQNGLYVQRLAPMMRIAVPYGLLSSRQLRKLAFIARHYDKGYAHFTTRQNIQFSWPALEDSPDILAHLAEVEMHAIQTSGNCIRNTTTDQFAGVTVDELEDSRPYCEIIRQWSTFHPEFAYLPRKFKIAVCGTAIDRVATQVHDIGVYLVEGPDNTTGFRILAGGGLGRTPLIGQEIFDFVEKRYLLTALEAILRVYNRMGRRDNKYKSRIKILVKELGVDEFQAKVMNEWHKIKDGSLTLTDAEIQRCTAFFTDPAYQDKQDSPEELTGPLAQNALFQSWHDRNVHSHKRRGYAIVTLALKQTGVAPGNVSDAQLDYIADLTDAYSFGEMRVTHQQNVVLADVEQEKLYTLWQQLQRQSLASRNLGLLTDVVCCPGGDFCALANAKSIPIAESIQRSFNDHDELMDIGEISINISGCMNACGHHHVGNIGILGVDKKGKEFYQVSLGGSSRNEASLGKILGPAFAQEEIPSVIQTIVSVYKANRSDGEKFLDTYKRIGMAAFKERVYAKAD
ncbi:MAG: nitrite/sulfite reductase [Gammaproteobacteria bacterium]|jgi:sulfite reductase (NADPH) hemoprotein beta-component|nr:nitrite/sulfite reductase [Gammaproteobacteria bacterium]MDP6537687.1 nitrite/sulfite reductase [Gammaproteobacteria bacterium]MDP6732268.1 nitrite/sulfite reductase [Gammaproteobacteria bacterium]|tara:strand:- start:1172 stop:2830 length:1659 start_codon:yes stop_codon:yes gene_type:complete